jgi:hypothetical protein
MLYVCVYAFDMYICIYILMCECIYLYVYYIVMCECIVDCVQDDN